MAIVTSLRPARRRTRPAALDVLAGLLLAPLLGWAVVRLLGVESGWPWVPLIAFTPYAAIGATVLAAVVLLLRRWAVGAVAAVVALTLALPVLPRLLPDGDDLPAGPPLRVLTANLMVGAGDERAVLDLARRLDVDVLALQEFTPADAEGLAAAGVDALLPHRAAFPAPGVIGSALYSRHPLRAIGLRVHRSTFTQAYATVDVPGARPVHIESVHPLAPATRLMIPGWRRDLAGQVAATPDGPVRVLAGDFNATLDHALLRTLVDTGYRDAAEVAGSGLRGTWPYDEKWIIPGVALDRVLADRRVGVRAARPYRTPGSDHKAFYADLVLPPT